MQEAATTLKKKRDGGSKLSSGQVSPWLADLRDTTSHCVPFAYPLES